MGGDRAWTLGCEGLTREHPTGGYVTPVLANGAPDGDLMPAQAFASTRELSLKRGRMVAAAPTMLDALEEVRTYLAVYAEQSGTVRLVLARVEAAIAKAKGGAD